MDFGVLEHQGVLQRTEWSDKRLFSSASAQKELVREALSGAHRTRLLIAPLVSSSTPFNSGLCGGSGTCLMPCSARCRANTSNTYFPLLSVVQEKITCHFSFSKRAQKSLKQLKETYLDLIVYTVTAFEQWSTNMIKYLQPSQETSLKLPKSKWTSAPGEVAQCLDRDWKGKQCIFPWTHTLHFWNSISFIIFGMIPWSLSNLFNGVSLMWFSRKWSPSSEESDLLVDVRMVEAGLTPCGR